MHRMVDPILPILCILGYWAMILGTLEGLDVVIHACGIQCHAFWTLERRTGCSLCLKGKQRVRSPLRGSKLLQANPVTGGVQSDIQRSKQYLQHLNKLGVRTLRAHFGSTLDVEGNTPVNMANVN